MNRKQSIARLLERRIRESLDADYESLSFLDRLCALETAIRWATASGQAYSVNREADRRRYLELLQARVLELPPDQRVALLRGRLPESANRA